MSSSHWIQTLAVLTLLLAGCSILNREGPDVTCADLNNGAKNACEDDIIATCVDGKVTFEVCDVGACSETWQTDGKFRCSQDDPAPDLQGTGGTGGSGGTGGAAGGGTGGGTGGSGGCDPTGPCLIVDNGTNGIEAFAVAGPMVYFSDGKAIQSVPKTGGFPTVLATGITSNASWNMSVDSKHVYVRTGGNTIARVPLGGGDLETFTEQSNGPFAADKTNVYWLGYSQISGQGLWLTPKAGGDQVEIAHGVSIQPLQSLVAQDGYLYWASGETMSRVSTSGQLPTVPTSIPVGISTAHFAVGPDALYFAGWSEGVIAKVPFTGGGLTELVTGQSYPNQIVVTDDAIYWDAGSHTGRAIYKVGMSGVAPTEIADLKSSNVAAVSRMLTDDTHVYWADWGRIHRSPK